MSKSTRGAAGAANLARLAGIFAAVLAGGATSPALAQPPQILGSDAAACQPGAEGPAALVRVTGFKDRRGRLRLQYYADDAKTWLASGAYLRRQEVPMTADGDMVLCITMPAPGAFAFVALHDRDEDGRLSVWSDGVGFSNNPRLALAKPRIESVVHPVGRGVTPITIVMNYRRGLSVRPLDR